MSKCLGHEDTETVVVLGFKTVLISCFAPPRRACTTVKRNMADSRLPDEGGGGVATVAFPTRFPHTTNLRFTATRSDMTTKGAVLRRGVLDVAVPYRILGVTVAGITE